jgi:hypothetical protein
LWIASTGALLLLAVVGGVVQGLVPTFSIAAPQRLSITYVEDRTHAGWTVDAFAPVPNAMRAVAAFSTKPRRISDVAPLSYFAPAGAPRFVPPTATVIVRPSVNGLRLVTIDLHGSREAAQMYVTIPKSAEVKSVDIRGWHFDTPRSWENQDAVAIACMSRDCASASLTLTLASRTAASIAVFEHRFGLPDFARPLLTARPVAAVPSQNGDGVTLVNTVVVPTAP